MGRRHHRWLGDDGLPGIALQLSMPSKTSPPGIVVNCPVREQEPGDYFC